MLNKFDMKDKRLLYFLNENARYSNTQLAKKIGLTTVAVSWGFHSTKLLKSEEFDYLANSFKMLYKYL